jgi:hypothetical protein
MRLVYTRERNHIGTKWSRVTCLALPLVAAQSLGSRALVDSQSLRCLMLATGNNQLQINKQTVLKDATRRYECVSARIT